MDSDGSHDHPLAIRGHMPDWTAGPRRAVDRDNDRYAKILDDHHS
jgi:hypothetical protein